MRRGLAGEAADLLYHLAVLLTARGVAPGDVAAKLAERRARHAARSHELARSPRRRRAAGRSHDSGRAHAAAPRRRRAVLPAGIGRGRRSRGAVVVPRHVAVGRDLRPGDDPFAALRAVPRDEKPADGGDDLPPFTGGAVGYVGYDAVRRLERLPDTKPIRSGCPTRGSASSTRSSRSTTCGIACSS